MENLTKGAISSLFESMKSREEVRLLIPMGYIPGMPILTIKNDQLVAAFPFLRYKITGEVDRTLVFPIKYVIEYLIPENQVVGFHDLSTDTDFADIKFNEFIGFFRHNAIKDLDKNAYSALKEETLNLYDKLVSFLLGESDDFSQNEENKLRNNLLKIIEPFIFNVYERLDKDFYNKYIQK